MAMIEVKNLTKTYRVGDGTLQALKRVSFSIHQGEFVVIWVQADREKQRY